VVVVGWPVGAEPGILTDVHSRHAPVLSYTPDRIGITRVESSTQPAQSRFSTGICSRGWVAGPSITSPL
jgi:hypothetical protein